VRRAGNRLISTLFVLAFAAVVAPTASPAATTVGQAPPAAGASYICGPGYGAQLSAADGTPYLVPSPGGVITRWRSSATGTVGLLVWAGSGLTLTLIAEDQKASAGVLTNFPTRIPVSGGERIGLHMLDITPGCLHKTDLGPDRIGVAVTGLIGSPTLLSEQSGYRFNVAVDIEADADKDGFGDETQDLCPTDASLQGPCPDVAKPQTTIGKHPAKKTAKRRAKFVFSASEPVRKFECKLDKGPFSSCKSPYRRKVSPGPHSFRVRAIDIAGNRDSSPAKFSWTVLG